MDGVVNLTAEDIDAALDAMEAIRPIQDRYAKAEMNSAEYFDCIRQLWAHHLSDILQFGMTDPYFVNWRFTPIEREAWNCIRRLGLKLYPQVPVAQYFIDFGDPIRKIGVELDGKAFHNAARDTARDERLWAQGWRIFRIPGREAYQWAHPPTEPDMADGAPRDSYEYNRALEQFCATGDGVLWAIQIIYYARREYNESERCISFGSLHDHRLVDFPLTDEPEDDDEA